MKRGPAEQTINEAVAAYPLEGIHVGAVRYGKGHINDTFCVYRQLETGDTKRYIFQRINREVFKHVEGLMSNIRGVCDWAVDAVKRRGGDTKREAMNLLKTEDGKDYFTDSTGEAWRCYLFVEDTYTLQEVQTPKQFAESARSFGEFFKLLEDYPAEDLHETIPNFHDTRDRYRLFLEAIKADPMDRVKDVQEEIAWVYAREEDTKVLMDALENGTLPLRVTHNDTKLNNVLFDKATDQGICVIDLDTVMPGLIVNDFGDAIRFGANDNAEDESDMSKVNFRLDLYEIYLQAYLEACGDRLTDAERDHLAWGARMMTLECGIRFLTDFILGDTYFSTHRPGHNLDRARTQFKLVEQMEEQWDGMNGILDSLTP